MEYKIGDTALSEADVNNMVNVFANTYFAMMEATGMVLTEMERLLALRGQGMRGSEKQKHKIAQQHIRALKNIIKDMYDEHPDVFAGDWNKWDYWRSDAADVARLCLYLYDRTQGELVKSQQIEEFISSMPERNKCISKLISNIRIR